jgi:predicted nucleic acid-binding protein
VSRPGGRHEYVDATVVAMAERLGSVRLYTLDRRDFGIIRPRHVASLELLP